jgi:hypothetical protein
MYYTQILLEPILHITYQSSKCRESSMVYVGSATLTIHRNTRNTIFPVWEHDRRWWEQEDEIQKNEES